MNAVMIDLMSAVMIEVEVVTIDMEAVVKTEARPRRVEDGTRGVGVHPVEDGTRGAEVRPIVEDAAVAEEEEKFEAEIPTKLNFVVLFKISVFQPHGR